MELARPALQRVVIAIPVKNEEARLGRLLQGVAGAAEAAPLPVTATILANDCTDGTVALARAFRDPRVQVEVHQISLPPSEASAGRARRVAMDLANRDGALLMTTDGDAVPDKHWIVAALSAAKAGADVVCGTISAKVDHVLATVSGARITRAEAMYCALQHEVRHCIDQMALRQPGGGRRPHYVESGASLAIHAHAYRAIGGLPWVDSSEDRALVYRAETHGLSVHYAWDMSARVSARLRGRAVGGMADCLRERMHSSNPLADQAMLPVAVLRELWSQAASGRAPLFPDRSIPCGPRMRASDLETNLGELQSFVDTTVLPDFAQWMQARHGEVG